VAARAWDAWALPDCHAGAYLRIIPYFDEDVSVFADLLTLTTCITLTLQRGLEAVILEGHA